MEAATIMVLVLTAGVFALLVWFEINSRRNEARKKQASDTSPEGQSEADSETENRKAA
jgi:hypothetical protein